MLNSQSRRGSSPKTLLVWQQGWDEESFTGKTTLNQEIMRFDTLTMNQRNREQNCLNWLNHAKWSLILNFINSTSPTFPAPFIFFKGFFLWIIFGRKTYLGISMWNSEKTLTRRGKNFFFSYHVVKVGEFMKLSYACEDIVSRGFSRNWRRSLC